MTTDQVREIDAMNLTDQAVNQLMQSMGTVASIPAVDSTPPASQPATTTQTSQLNPMLLLTLIQLLQSRSQTTG